MPNYRRADVPGATYFFTVALADRSSASLVSGIGMLRQAFAKTRAEWPFRVDAMVVLSDHLHAVWTLPEGGADFSTRWGAIKGRFSQGLHRAGFIPPDPVGRGNGGVNPALRRKGELGLWQSRFWEHLIRDERDYRHHVEYCWGNPVKHGLVTRAADWPYSSIHRDIRRGIVSSEWSGESVEGEFGE